MPTRKSEPDAADRIVEAINDLTRVTIALHGDFSSRSDAVRKLSELAIPTGRIASILAMKQADVASVLAKAKRGSSKNRGGTRGGTVADG